MSHTLIVLLQDRPGVLHRAVSLFRRRGYNIASLTVGHSEHAGVSRMTVVVDAKDVEQVIKQLSRLVEVLTVSDVTDLPVIVRETALLKVVASAEARAELIAVGASAGARVVDVGPSTIVFEMTDEPPKIERFIDTVRQYGLREVMRSGHLAMRCGASADTVSGSDAAPYYYQADGMAAPDLPEA
jgi:acetolactate synthase-1/3 small subunit